MKENYDRWFFRPLELADDAEENAPVVAQCGDCNACIYEGDFYYDFDGFALCDECIDKYHIRAEGRDS